MSVSIKKTIHRGEWLRFGGGYSVCFSLVKVAQEILFNPCLVCFLNEVNVNSITTAGGAKFNFCLLTDFPNVFDTLLLENCDKK